MPSLICKFAVCFFAVTTSSVVAGASSLWKWSYSGAGIVASGTFITSSTQQAGGGYLITAIAGSRNGQKITALQPTGTWIPGNEPYRVDNLVFKSPGAELTKHGFGFETADGNYANPFYADFLPKPEYLEFYSMPASGTSTELPVVFSASLVSSTPEPGTFILTLLAFALAGFLLARRQPTGC